MPCQQAPIHREKKRLLFFSLDCNRISIHFRRVCIYSALASQDHEVTKG